MHEIGLARTLFHQVRRIWLQHPGTAISQVNVEVGPLRGVEPLQLIDAFRELTATESGNPIPLVVQQVPLTAICQECGIEVEVQDFRFVCPRCGNRQLSEVQGDCVKLMSVDLSQ